MKRSLLHGVVLLSLFAANAFSSANTEIWYDVAELSPGRWEYTYEVTNKVSSLIPEIEEFTIWFDYGLYDNLVVTTPETPPEWDQIVWQVEPVLEDPGGYDAVATNLYIDIGESLNGFSVSFDWLGVGEPGSQEYHIIDPDNYPVPIEIGWTIPEPATLCLLGLGGLVLLRKRRTKERSLGK